MLTGILGFVGKGLVRSEALIAVQELFEENRIQIMQPKHGMDES